LQNWWKIVANSRQEYLYKLQVAVQELHQCGATHHQTVPVHEVFRGKTAWEGLVEVFDLHGHPKAKRAYAWAHLDGPNDDKTRYVAVLEIPPVDSAKTAVKASIMADFKKK
jgi:hypothetical protein